MMLLGMSIPQFLCTLYSRMNYTYTSIFIGCYLWSFGRQIHWLHHHRQIFSFSSCTTNRFLVAVGVCTVIVTNHRWCHNVLKTWLRLVSNFFVLTTFWCHLLLLNRHTDSWNLPFVKYTQFYCIMYIFLQPENIWTNKLSHPLGCCC